MLERLIRVRSSRVRRLSGVVVWFALLACDPVRSFEGRVRSAARDGREAPRALVQAKVSEECPGRTAVLGYSDAEGRVKGGGLGWWSAECRLEITASGAGHAPRTLDIQTLCKGDSSCHSIDFDVVLERANEHWEPHQVTVRYSAYPRDLLLYTVRGGQDEVLCRGPCVTKLPAGEHLLRLGPDGKSPISPTVTPARLQPVQDRGVPVRLDRDVSLEGRLSTNETALAVGSALLVVGTIGTYVMLYGLYKEEAALTWIGAGSAAGGVAIGLPLMLSGLPSASLEVRETR